MKPSVESFEARFMFGDKSITWVAHGGGATGYGDTPQQARERWEQEFTFWPRMRARVAQWFKRVTA